TIDPAEAQGLLDRMVIRNARPTGLFLVVDEPNLGLRLVMLREPGAPFLPVGYIQRLAYFHFVLAVAVEDNHRRRTSQISCRAGWVDSIPRNAVMPARSAAAAGSAVTLRRLTLAAVRSPLGLGR